MSKRKQRSRPLKDEELVRENERLRQRLETVRNSRLGASLTSILRDIVKYGLCGLFLWLCVTALAGHVTVVDAAIDVCASLPDVLAEIAPSWIVEILALLVTSVVYLVLNRTKRLNKSLNERLGKLIEKYEQIVDPRRSSSGLGSDGQTHERDVR